MQVCVGGMPAKLDVLDRGVAVAAANAKPADVVLVAELDRLQNRQVAPGVVVRAHVQVAGDRGERQAAAAGRRCSRGQWCCAAPKDLGSPGRDHSIPLLSEQASGWATRDVVVDSETPL